VSRYSIICTVNYLPGVPPPPVEAVGPGPDAWCPADRGRAGAIYTNRWATPARGAVV
jgi:hypothetical protein